jgi:hypothetical protein
MDRIRETNFLLPPRWGRVRVDKQDKTSNLTPPFSKACLPVGRGGWEGFEIYFPGNLKDVGCQVYTIHSH